MLVSKITQNSVDDCSVSQISHAFKSIVIQSINTCKITLWSCSANRTT